MDDNERTESAREHDDSDLIEGMKDAPDQGGRSAHGVSRNVGTRDELKQAVGEGGVTRVRASDKKPEADQPRFNRK